MTLITYTNRCMVIDVSYVTIFLKFNVMSRTETKVPKALFNPNLIKLLQKDVLIENHFIRN